MDPETLDLKKLRVFCLVARHGSMQAAASRLNVTLSAVSLSIRRLEEHLGFALFKRLPNRLVLTSEGTLLAKSADAIFAGIKKILSESQLTEAHRGRLSVSVNADLAWYVVPKISDFLRLYPGIELSVYVRSSADALRQVDNGEIDMAIGRFPKVSARLAAEPVIETSVSLVCPRRHPLASQRVLRLADVARNRLVAFSSAQFRQSIDSVFSRAGLAIDSYIEAVSCETVAEFVLGGVGLGLIHSFCRSRVSTADLHFRDFRRHLPPSVFSVLYRKDAGLRPELFRKLRQALTAEDARYRAHTSS